MEPCGTHAYISLGADNSHSAKTLNFLCERKKIISFFKLTENLTTGVESCHQVMTGERTQQTEDFVHTAIVVVCRVCKLVTLV
jgi:hypothetical protein